MNDKSKRLPIVLIIILVIMIIFILIIKFFVSNVNANVEVINKAKSSAWTEYVKMIARSIETNETLNSVSNNSGSGYTLANMCSSENEMENSQVMDALSTFTEINSNTLVVTCFRNSDNYILEVSPVPGSQFSNESSMIITCTNDGNCVMEE